MVRWLRTVRPDLGSQAPAPSPWILHRLQFGNESLPQADRLARHICYAACATMRSARFHECGHLGGCDMRTAPTGSTAVDEAVDITRLNGVRGRAPCRSTY